jgi:cobalamin biosynthesis protein CobD/CbiB
MSFFALIAALLLEQFHPISTRKYLFSWLSYYVNFFRYHFNAGEHKHGKIAWLLVVVPLLTIVVVMQYLLHQIHPIFSWAVNVLVLYITMGFHQFNRYVANIQQALRADRLDDARRLLSIWRGIPAHELSANEVSRVAIEEILLASHRTIFGVIVWFVLFSIIGLGGAAGALLYRIGQLLHQHWAAQDEAELANFGSFACHAFQVLEWLPVRVTALTFAIVGNFEDTVYCWRTQATSWQDKGAGILLASGAGSLGVRLGMAIPQGGSFLDRSELGLGEEADVDSMQSTIGLVWRSVVFMLILLLLMTISGVLG